MIAVGRALTSSFTVCEDLRSCFPGLTKGFVPLDKMHVSLAVVAVAQQQVQQLIQARTLLCCEACGLLTCRRFSKSTARSFPGTPSRTPASAGSAATCCSWTLSPRPNSRSSVSDCMSAYRCVCLLLRLNVH